MGFDACGVAASDCIPEEEFELDAWLADGCQGGMHFMEQHRDMRHDPRLLVPGARSVISVLLGYKPDRQMEGPARIAQYAYGEDYHERMKRMLYQMIGAIREQYPGFEAKPCVDTAPISDKLWAARAGLGWIGRNTLLVNPDLGSYCFIGELVTTAECDTYDVPMQNRCGDCTACVQACPNQAISVVPSSKFQTPTDSSPIGIQNSEFKIQSGPSPTLNSKFSILNSPICNAYNTIENRETDLPVGLRLSGYAFGCDCCQLACPYNRAAAVRYHLTDERKGELESLATADEPAFRRFVKHSALSRIKYAQWRRNTNK